MEIRKWFVAGSLIAMLTAWSAAQNSAVGIHSDTINPNANSKAHIIQTNFGSGESYSQGNAYFVDGKGFDNQVVAEQFTTTKAAHFAYARIPTAVYTALGGKSSGRTSMVLETDSSGLPSGTVIDHLTQRGTAPDWPTVKILNYTCKKCPLLKKNTSYWIVAYETDANVQMTWNQNDTGDTSGWAFDDTGSLSGPWTSGNGNPNPAYAVYGTK